MITLVLRVSARGSGLRGTALHVASGESRPFASASELWRYLEECAASDGIGSACAGWLDDDADARPPSLRRPRRVEGEP